MASPYFDIHSRQRNQLIERLPQAIDYRYDISAYDEDNLYPQRIEQVMLRSPITLAAVTAKSDFLNGEGFEMNNDMVINDHGMSVGDLLNRVSFSFARIPGFALHLDVNLLGEVVSTKMIPFEFVRYGIPDEMGRHSEVRVNINWERNAQKLPQRNAEKIFTFPLWPGSIEKAAAIVQNLDPEAFEKFPGFVWYFTIEPDVYPRASFDAVIDSAQTEAEIQLFELSNIQNGFLGASIFKHRGKIESDPERQRIMSKLAEMKGSANANSIMLIETPFDFDGDIIENIPANGQDILFDQTNTNVVNRVTQNFGMPPSILGVMPESGIFNQEQIRDSYIYYNLRTRRERQILARVFNKLGKWFATPFEVGKIIEQSFTAGAINPEDQATQTPTTDG